jgi:integrase
MPTPRFSSLIGNVAWRFPVLGTLIRPEKMAPASSTRTLFSRCEEAVKLIARQPKCEQFVFVVRNRPTDEVWKRALKEAGIKDFRWHDLRHTWASWHVQNGTPLHDLQELGGWESVEMVRRYAHLTPGHLAKHAAKLSTILAQAEAGKSASA